MTRDHTVQAVVGVTGSQAELGGSTISRERFVRVDLPSSFRNDDIGLMAKDLRALADIAEQYPDDMTTLQNAVLVHDFTTVDEVANRIGLTEAELSARGGGSVGVAVVVLTVLVLYALASGGDTGPTPDPEPVGPGDPGRIDAGTGDASDAGTG